MLKNRDGMTLLEVLMASAVMLVIALALSNLMFQQSNQQKSAIAKATFNSLVTSVQGAVSNGRMLRQSADAQGWIDNNAVGNNQSQ
jgi:prepilin-type N-terminal cleavage/methylation domain-containing protein